MKKFLYLHSSKPDGEMIANVSQEHRQQSIPNHTSYMTVKDSWCERSTHWYWFAKRVPVSSPAKISYLFYYKTLVGHSNEYQMWVTMSNRLAVLEWSWIQYNQIALILRERGNEGYEQTECGTVSWIRSNEGRCQRYTWTATLHSSWQQSFHDHIRLKLQDLTCNFCR